MPTVTDGRRCLQPVNGNEQCQLLAGHLVPCSPDPDGSWVTVPNEPWSEILPGLYQGGSWMYRPEELVEFDAVLTLHRGADSAPASVLEQRFHFRDGPDMPDGTRLSEAVNWVFSQWRSGKRVLVRCQGGLNRSGLVVALVLYKAGYDINDSITLIRDQRSPYALCNARFVQYLRRLP